jgi:UDP-N-acetylglucosamine--N-acetylmuramyl-(pentapeptide) pyrophosphoryl-undecaprenol N-acetylglucosamine transferase
VSPENLSHRHPIVLVAGGTGGHVFPAEALAGSLRAKGYTLALFTDRRGESWTGTLGSVDTHAIRAGRVSGVSFFNRLRGVAELALGSLQSRKLLARLKPSVVVGFGGYTSVPAMMAATSLSVPTVIHEQNALLGRANRLLAPRVAAIATSFANVARMREEDASKVIFTGNPVREAVRQLRDTIYAEPSRGGEVHLLITGGSQGASVFARVVPEALARLPEDLRGRLRIAQQARPEDLGAVRAAYADAELTADVAPFFEDLADRLGRAHIVICRAGASTCAELTCAGRPAILVPYPSAADDHQTANARAVANANGAELVAEPAFTPETLAARLKLLIEQPGRLTAMARAAQSAGHKDAAANLAILVTNLVPVHLRGPSPNDGRAAA